MVRTQVQLPEGLYRKARAFAAEREMSLAELTRRSLELLLERYPAERRPAAKWRLPRVDGGGLKVPLARLRDVLADEEQSRGLPRK